MMDNLDYGVIGNCRTAALISKFGSIDWLCLPEFDSPSIFAGILDKKRGGSFSFVVSDSYKTSQRYISGTNILCTTFESEEGAFEVLDFMPRYKTGEYSDEYYLPAELYRYIRLLRGEPVFNINYSPAMDYARGETSHTIKSRYVRSGLISNPDNSVYLYSGIPLDTVVNGYPVKLEKDNYLLLTYNQKLIGIDIKRVYLEYSRTKVYWLNWTNRSKRYPLFEQEVERSMLILKLMSFQPTGAVLAALTTSIPETIGETRNWDYRYCWLRDASMSIDTLLSMGHRGAARIFIGYVKSIIRSKDDSFQIMYGIRGEKNLNEQTLPHLSGYAGSVPVRIGNAAYIQKQNDSLGYLMDVIFKYYQYFPGTLDEVEEIWEVVKNIVRTVYKEWRLPDQGIWEIRNRSEHFVFSKVMCWVALDRACKTAHLLGMNEYEERWRKEAELIREDVEINGWNTEIESFTQYYGSDSLDSSLLLMEEYGFISANDPKYISTLKAIKRELFMDGLMYRYKNRDDFGIPKSAFTICTFWLIKALFVTGEKDEARGILDQMLKYSNHLGLLSEDLDFKTKRQLGNFPQAYSHLALVNTIKLFSDEKERSRFIRP